MKNKFVSIIAGNAEGIRLKRAENTASAAKLAQQSLINDLSKTVQTIEAQLNQKLDLGPDSADSLRPVERNFDADSWVREVQSLKVSLNKANESLSIALATNSEWFDEIPPVIARGI